MDMVWQPLWATLAWGWVGLLALALALCSAWLRTARFKGWLGEQMVRRWLAQDLDPLRYHCLHNVTLQLADGSTTQIDHVVLSTYGVFVLESKHMQGWIFGEAKRHSWMQVLHCQRFSFQNPLHQNWRHIKALEELLQLPLRSLHSVVVFTGDSQFKTAMPGHVLQGRACTAYIRQQQAQLLSTAQLQQALQTLEQQRLQPSWRTHGLHVRNMQARHQAAARRTEPRLRVRPVRSTAQRETAAWRAAALATAPELERANARVTPPPAPTTTEALPTACPRCSGALQQRCLPDPQGRQRMFWRCVHFPHCRFLQVDSPAQQPATA